jgi:two-component system, OmpR family, copper resistance phosphate regulon response regulator CusR
MSGVLLACQQAGPAAFLARGLRANGFTTAVAESGDAVLAAVHSGQVALLVLDSALSGPGGRGVLDSLRSARVGVPVIVLTARKGIDAAVAGLHGSTDDFVTKPFCFEELLARVRLRLQEDHPAPETAMLRYGSLELDLRGRRVRVGDRPVDLTSREFLLIETFVRNRDRVLSRQQLLSQVWGYGHNIGSNVIDVYVCSLRRKLGASLITTLRGMGYRLETGAPPAPQRSA